MKFGTRFYGINIYVNYLFLIRLERVNTWLLISLSFGIDFYESLGGLVRLLVVRLVMGDMSK